MISTSNPTVSYLQKAIALLEEKDNNHDQSIFLEKIDWQDYETILRLKGDKNNPLLRYNQGSLTIMSPSRNHEIYKETIGALLEIYLRIKRIKYYPSGSTIFRIADGKKGIEPDKSYCLNNLKDFPDLAIEIIITSGGVNSLEIYKDLGVKEVWFWQNNELKSYILQDNDGYQEVKISYLFPDLDLDLLASYVVKDDHLDAVLEFMNILEKA